MKLSLTPEQSSLAVALFTAERETETHCRCTFELRDMLCVLADRYGVAELAQSVLDLEEELA